jgi:hypothetical protein
MDITGELKSALTISRKVNTLLLDAVKRQEKMIKRLEWTIVIMLGIVAASIYFMLI